MAHFKQFEPEFQINEIIGSKPLLEKASAQKTIA